MCRFAELLNVQLLCKYLFGIHYNYAINRSCNRDELNIYYNNTASSIAQWQSAGFEFGRSRVQSPVKDRLCVSLVVQCWLRVREVPGSIPSQGPPPRKPRGIVLASSTGGPGFNPQSRTASSIASWYSAGFEYGRSRVQSLVKDRVIPKTL